MKRSWPTIWNIGGTVPKFTNLQYPPATPKSHDTCITDCLQDLKENKQLIHVYNYNIRVAKMYNSDYFNMLLVTYISIKKLTDDNTPNVIKSIAPFHVYYTIARFMKNPTLMQEYITPEVIKAVCSRIPIKYREFESQTTDGDGNYFRILATVNYSNKDYKSMIPYTSNGITEIGKRTISTIVGGLYTKYFRSTG